MKDYKEKSKQNFNMQAKVYDESNYSKYPRECYPNVIKVLSEIEFDTILDLGCGTGSVLALLLEQKPNIHAYGLDLSDEMLTIARQKLEEKAELIQGDSENLPYKDNSFDVVICTESFHHYPNPLKALDEIHRVLKPQGKFILCDTWMFTPIRQIMNVFIKFSDGGDVRIYSEIEITKMFNERKFRNISWHKSTKYTYICIGEK
ncbi:class I SAM-dependent methyltransferase [Clostridium sp. CF011]|uniref:class I SAM-dependent methyltransferase n=1 Tax=Clostridium sp. CF011 TaxID=2843318 RepID=UPI001C0B0A14|nr:class I SAM-dependent methyltransferase [Clostridium sp. CF011]MBU3093672.1 class I SAM-dependent methyltransferase [Clostridium sp. CF011]WAG70671.1 class I SAM-dependent methyltransferase [Clostridium sp. CF011]